MRVAFSNITWGSPENEPHFKLLSELGVDAVEIAPSVFWKEPVESTREERVAFRRLLDRYGLTLVGFQALLFARPDLGVFGTDTQRRDTMEYLLATADLCRELGGSNLGWGGKRVLGSLGVAEGTRILEAFCRELAGRLEGRGITVSFEPLSRTTTDIIQTMREGRELVEAVGHPSFVLQCDSKSLVENGEDAWGEIHAAAPVLGHFHVNDYGNSVPGSTGADHSVFGRALKAINYSHYISVEVVKTFDDVAGTIRHIKRYLDEHYLAA